MKNAIIFLLSGFLVLAYGFSQLKSATAQEKNFTKSLSNAIYPEEIKKVPQMIDTARTAGAVFERRVLFVPNVRPISASDNLKGALHEGVVFDLDKAAVRKILKEDVPYLTLPIAIGDGGFIELELKKVNIFAPEFIVETSKQNDKASIFEESYGIHYRGIIKGDSHSLAAISIFKNEVMGIFSADSTGNFVLGRLGGKNITDRHILYDDRNLNFHPNNFCDVKVTDGVTPSNDGNQTEEVLVRSVKIYVEANHDLFLNKGSAANTISYVTGFFNQSATLIANTGVPVVLSEVFVWTTPSPFTATTSQGQLDLFKATRSNFNGDLAHLVDLQNIGGVAYVNAYCSPGFKYAYSGIFPLFNNVPTYSFTVQLFSHETGHNLGSPHTHACAWNGNNTAIDGCAAVEGSCPDPGLPVGGGTIMSYCYLTAVGVNFNLGYGPQPSSLIFNQYRAASCLADPGTGFDYDGDHKSDISVFRPTDGAWYLQRSQAGFYGSLFGFGSDKIAPADYDGDGKTDIAVYRPSTGIWYVFNSSDGNVSYYVFGLSEDLPTPADYDGDGKADISVFRPSTGTWYRQDSSNGSFHGVQFGASDDKPTVGDFDGDGKSDIAVFRPSTGAWYRIDSSDSSIHGELFGFRTDIVTPADYDGDGRADVAVYRPSNGYWYTHNSLDGAVTYNIFGLANDIPAPGDFDGDGKADRSVFRPSDGNWYRQNSSNGSFIAFQFGQNGDKPTQTAFRY